MLTENRDVLACPGCRATYVQHIVHQCGDKVREAALECPSCRVTVPVCQGFPAFDEARPGLPEDVEGWLAELSASRFDRDGRFEAFLKTRAARNVTDAYAAFQPFNESTRALYPLLPILREVLEPGDLILDTWGRTGYSGELLAGLFPEQRIISLWEGDSGALGYRGFTHWLPQDRRAPNLDVMFAHPGRPLPIATNAVRVVHGLDSLHRYRHENFIPEVLRTCRDDGVLLFPHVHLTNSEPDPWFDRGCEQYHGREWRRWLDVLLEGSSRKGWVLAELDLFESRLTRLEDEHDTRHYNGVVVIAPERFDGYSLGASTHAPIEDSARLLINPLLDVDPHRSCVDIGSGSLGGSIPRMLSRHPAYAARLEGTRDTKLNGVEACVLWHAGHGKSIADIASDSGLDREEVIRTAEDLARREVLHPAPISAAMAALQAYYAFGHLPHESSGSFSELWQAALPRYGGRPVMQWLEDDSVLLADDVEVVVRALRAALCASGLTPGATVGLSCQPHPAALLVLWAAWLERCRVLVADPAADAALLTRWCKRASVEVLVTDRPAALELQRDTLVIGIGPQVSAGAQEFEEWLEPHLDAEVPENTSRPEDIAVLLPTSGSTGEPKLVALDQRSLCSSAATLVGRFDWSAGRLLSLGPLHMMSGLRNPAVAAPLAGATILIPGEAERRLPLAAWETAVREEATIITTSPAWLATLLGSRGKLSPSPAVAQILATGAALPAGLRERAESALDTRVVNYYGLTETGGICAADAPNGSHRTGVGTPCGALLRIVDGRGQAVDPGEEGRVLVHGPQNMRGYLGAGTVEASGAWIETGDLGAWTSDGDLELYGRVDDVLKAPSGERLHPLLVEQSVQSVRGVDLAGITLAGSPQRMVVLYTGTSDELDLLEQLRGVLAEHERPARLFRCADLPRTPAGKLDRRALGLMAERMIENRESEI